MATSTMMASRIASSIPITTTPRSLGSNAGYARKPDS
jgi:hypothetical protein